MRRVPVTGAVTDHHRTLATDTRTPTTRLTAGVGGSDAGDQRRVERGQHDLETVDVDTGKENWEIDWAFRVGDLVKIRVSTTWTKTDPMHHPFHIHGADGS